MTQDERVNFAVVGYGHIGKRHAEMINKNPEARLVAVIDTKDKQALAVPADVPFFNSLHDFLQDELAGQTQVINIATPNGFHAQQAILCLEAKKHAGVH